MSAWITKVISAFSFNVRTKFVLSFKVLFTAVLLLVSLVFVSTHAFAAAGINSQVNFQGKLVNADGTNVADGSYSVVFTLYDASSGGTNLWSETQSVATTDGIFHVALGSVTSLSTVNFNSDSLYLGIKVGSDAEMTPRIRFASVPYAFNSQKVNGLTVTNTSGNPFSSTTTLQIGDGKTVVFNNGLTFSGTDSTTFTFPTASDTVVGTAATQTLTNKTIGSTGLVFSGAATDITTGTNEDLTISPNGTGRTVFANGNVGIGSTSPVGLLNINGAVTGKALVQLNTTGDQALFVASKSGTPIFTLGNNGHVAIGSNSQIDNCGFGTGENVLSCLQETFTNPNLWNEGYVLNNTLNPTANMTTNIFGVDIEQNIQSGNTKNFQNVLGEYNWIAHKGSGTISKTYGYDNETQNQSSGTITTGYAAYNLLTNRSNGAITTGYGDYVSIANSGSGTISNAYGLYIEGDTNRGGGPITNNVGIYIGDQSLSNSTSTYNLISNGRTSRNVFGGLVGIGTSTPFTSLHVASTSAGKALVVFDQLGSGDDIFTASQAGTTRFTIANDGTLTATKYTTNGGLLYTNASGLIAQTGAGTGSQCLLGGTTPTWGACSTGGGITGTGTLNYLPKFTPDGATIGNSLIYDNGTNVGIGSTVPGYNLDITGTGHLSGKLTVDGGIASVANNNITIQPGGTGVTVIKNTSSGTVLDLQNSGGTSKWTIDQNGYLTQNGKIILNGVSAGNTQLLIKAPSGTIGYNIDSQNSGSAHTFTVDYNGNIFAAGYATASASLAVGYSSVPAGIGNAVFSGNVGIGTTNPTHNLEVNGSFQTYGGDFELRSGTGTTGTARVISNAGSLTLQEGCSTCFIFFQDRLSHQFAAFTNAGNLGIGTTSPLALLDLQGVGNSKGIANINGDGSQTLLTASVSGTTKFIIDNTGNVGIGTLLPAYPLDVNGTIRGTAIYQGANQVCDVSGNCAGTGGVIGGSGTLNYIAKFSPDGSHIGSSLLFDDGTNVGIGTSVPAYPLDIRPTGTSAQIRLTPATWTTGSLARIYLGDTNHSIKTTYAVGTEINDVNGTFITGGNVGIGTTVTSSYKLSVSGDVYASNNLLADGGTGLTTITGNNITINPGRSWQINTTTTLFSLKDATAGQDRVDIDTNGNVGIGTTNPQYKLDVNGAANFTGGLTYSGTPISQELTRTVPTTVNDYVEIGSLTMTNGTHNVRLTVNVDSTSFSESKTYIIPLYWHQTANVYQVAQPLTDSGAYGGNDFAVDVNVNNGTATFRLRRVSGSTAGTAYIRLESEGPTGDSFTALSGTGSVSAPTATITSTSLTQFNGNVGIGTTAPTQTLEVVRPSGGVIANFRATAGTTAQLRLTPSSGNAWDFDATTTNLIFEYNDANLISLSNAGNLGIGASTPLAKLDVAGNASISGNLTFGNTSTAQIQTSNLTDLTIGGTTTGNLWLQPTATNKLIVGSGSWTQDAQLNVGFNSGQFSTLAHFAAESNTATVLNVDIGNGINNGVNDALTLTRSLDGGTFPAAGAGVGMNFQIENSSKVKQTAAAIRAVLTTAAANNIADLTFSTQNGSTFAEAMRITGAGNIGIGTTAPVAKLDIAGSASASGNLTFRGASTAHTINVNDSGSLNFQVSPGGEGGAAAKSALFIQKDGNIGIGTTSPGMPLDLYSVAPTISFRSSNGTNQPDTGVILFTETTTTTPSGIKLRYDGSTGANGGEFLISDVTSGTITDLVSVMRNGNVGIGSITPGAKLDVNGTAKISGVITLSNYTGNNAVLYGTATTGVLAAATTSTAGQCLVSGGSTTYLPSWGSCSAGGSTAWSSITAPAANLSLSMSTFTTAFNWATGTSTNNLFSLTTDASANGTGTLLNVQTGASSTVIPLRVRAGSTEALYVNTGGNVGIGTTGPGAELQVGASVFSQADSTQMSVKMTDTTTSSLANGVIGAQYIAGPASASTVKGYGVMSDVGTGSGASDMSGANITAFNANFQGRAANTLGTYYGFRSGINFTSAVAGTVSNAYHFFASSPGMNSGTISNVFGLYIDSQKVSGVGSGYGVWQNGSSDLNYFAGNVGIGSTVPASLFDVNHGFNVTSAGNVGIGSTAPGAALDIEGKTNVQGLWLSTANATPWAMTIYRGDLGSSSAINFFDNAGTYEIWNSAGNTRNFAFDQSGNLTATGTLTINGTGNSSIAGNLGIGSTAPEGVLTVKGGTTGGNAAMIINQTGASTNDLFTASSSGTTKFTIANDGTMTDKKYGWGVAQFNGSGVVSSTALNLAGGSFLISGTLPVGNGGTGTNTAFTPGSVVFAGTSGVYSQDNANFYYDTANDRLGLGTSAPNQQLHLVKNNANAVMQFQTTSTGTNVGPNGTSSGADDATVGTVAWTNPGNVTASDNTYATQALGTSTTGHYLKATGFGFSIPSNATITGITVEVERSDTAFFTKAVDNSIKIVKGGTITGTDKSTGASWPGSDTFATFGSSGDLWGTTWTYSDINAANFGVVISAKNTNILYSASPQIDYIRITVTYTIGANATSWTQGIDYSNGGLFKISNGTALGTNDYFTINQSGNVGIGTTAPGYGLDLQSSATATAAAQIFNTNTGANAQGLIVKLGFTGTGTARTGNTTGNSFIQFQNGNGQPFGAIDVTAANTLTYRTGGWDFAEYFPKADVNESLPERTVVCYGDNGGTITTCSDTHNQIVGVISAQAGFSGGAEHAFDPAYAQVGLLGHLPVTVTTENGGINVGDGIVASKTVPGGGAKAITAGYIVGRATEAVPAGSGPKTITVLVQPMYSDPSAFLMGDGNVTIAQNAQQQYELRNASNQLFKNKAAFADAAIANLSAGKVKAQSLEVDGSLVLNGKTLDQYIQQSSQTQTASASATLDTSAFASASAVTKLTTSLDDLSKRVSFLENQASISAVLGASTSSLDMTKDATFSGSLMVLGKTTVNDLGVTGKIVSGLMAIDGLEGTLDVVGQPLKLQSSGFGSVDILDGKVVISDDGSVTVNGGITADTIKVKQVIIDQSDATSKSVGDVTIPAGTKSIDVQTAVLKATSHIFVTPERPVAVAAVKKNSTTFTITLENAPAQDLKVSWWIVN